MSNNKNYTIPAKESIVLQGGGSLGAYLVQGIQGHISVPFQMG